MRRSNLSGRIVYINDLARRCMIRPDPYVLPGLLRACADLSDLKTGKTLHALITRSLSPADAFVSSALISMYSKCGHANNARKIFDRMPDRDAVLWNSMISGYTHQGLVDDAMALFKLMPSSGIKPDLITWNALISGFSQAGDIEMSLRLFSCMQLDGIKPDVFSWTSIIAGFVHSFHYGKAFDMFRKMAAGGIVWPNSVTVSSLLPACSSVMNLRRGKELHGYALVIGVEEDLFVSSSLVDMYAKCGMIYEAGLLFDKMSERNTVTWNSMIFGYANNGYCKRAISLFYGMQDEGVKPDHLTFTAVFTACSHAGMIELGRNLFNLMQTEHGIQPMMEHYACMVDLLGRAGNLSDAFSFIEQMPIQPDSFVWGALLGACRTHGNLELARVAASHLAELEPKSAGSSLLLSNILIDAGRWDVTLQRKKLLKKHNVKRYLGCSWMQAG